MDQVKNFQCPNCGSPLTLQGHEAEIKCPYCGSAVIVPEELRPKPAAAPAPAPFSGQVFTPQYDQQISEGIATAGKVAAGIAISSMIAPIVITLVIFCIVGVFLVFLFWGINSTFQSASNLADPHALQTSISSTLIPALADLPTAEPPTAVPTPIAISTAFPKTLFHDDFSNKKSGWDVLDDGDYTLAYVKGGYRIFINAQDGGQTSWIDNTYKNVNVEVDVKYTDGPDDGRFGVTCRAKDGVGFYSFEFGPDGAYSIEKYTSGKSKSTSEALASGSMDASGLDFASGVHLRGDCVGHTLTFYIEGQPVLQANDSTFTSGGTGLIARTGPSGDTGVDVLFSNYAVKGQ